MTAPRVAGKRGRKPARHAPELHIRRFTEAADRGPAPESGDVSGGITDWGMLGNDTHSNCGAAAWVHYLMAKAGANTVTLDGATYTADDPNLTAAVLNHYYAYGRAQGEPGDEPDEGVSNDTWLKFLFDQGLIEAYAWVDLTNPDEAKWAMLDFHGLLVGLALTDQAETEFGNHQPWNISSTEPIDPNMGHDTVLVAYDTGGETLVTWGANQRCTITFAQAEIAAHDGDAWAIITKEDAARTGVNIDALRAEITRLGGTETPEPGGGQPPVPGPDSPQPGPAPTGPNSPRGDLLYGARAEVERIFDAARIEAARILDGAKAAAHALLDDVFAGSPDQDPPTVEGS